MMRLAIQVLLPAILLSVTLPFGSAVAQSGGSDGMLLSEPPDFWPSVAGGPFYCQRSFIASANASTGFQSEIADDIPVSFSGLHINSVTLLVAEWLAAWRQPEGIEINFYSGACPPALIPSQTFFFAWGVLTGFRRTDMPPAWTVYEMTATLPTAIEIVSPLSIGVVVKNSWGTSPPACGFMVTPDDSIKGCGGFYWDLPPQTPRWTATNIGDLCVCLTTDAATGVPVRGGESRDEALAASWGSIKGLFRSSRETPSAGHRHGVEEYDSLRYSPSGNAALIGGCPGECPRASHPTRRNADAILATEVPGDRR